MEAPLTSLDLAPVTLDPAKLPEYALRCTLRLFAPILASLVFTFVVATLAAKSRKAELVIIPALGILQAVPVLGFLTFTVVFFMGLFPGSQLGAECAAIFAVFTAQAWNMTFSFYQSLRTIPGDLDEVSRHFQLSPWLRFLRLEVPFAAPGLIWNTMMSMSGAWFFVVASEAIMVGDTAVKLPGIGSWIALAIEQQDITAVARAGSGRRRLCAVVGGGLCARDAGPARCSRSAGLWGPHARPGGDPHRHRERDLGPDRGVDRAAALGGGAGAADRAIPRRVPGQRAVPDRGGRHCVAAARSQYLA